MRSGHVSPSLPAAESKSKLCPKNWMAYGEKCYRLAKKSWVWNESKKDCEVRRAQTLIVQDLEETVMQKAQVARSSWGVSHPGFQLNWVHVGVVGCPSCPKPMHWCVMGGLVPLSSLTPFQDFISNIMEGTNHIWIGLHLPVSAQSWTWVDGAPVDQLM